MTAEAQNLNAVPKPETRHTRLVHFWATLMGGISLGVIAFALFGPATPLGLWKTLAPNVMSRGTTIDSSSPSVVEKIRQLSRLETVVYSLDKIVTGARQSAYLPDALVGDKLLLIAHGEVIAGIDLAQLGPHDVTVANDGVKVKLPAAQILTTRIDNGSTRVYSRTTGMLVAADPNLESQVRQAAETAIRQAAIDDGILDKAKQSARNSVTALLYGLGFHSVTVE